MSTIEKSSDDTEPRARETIALGHQPRAVVQAAYANGHKPSRYFLWLDGKCVASTSLIEAAQALVAAAYESQELLLKDELGFIHFNSLDGGWYAEPKKPSRRRSVGNKQGASHG